jgi:PTS system cellobiose-specific IIB component
MRILLACAAGMSTSLLANNIQKLATERALDITVDATSTSALDERSWRSVDVVLVGPQMRHLLPDISAQGAQYGVPVAAIPPQDYATADAQRVLEQATTLVEQGSFRRDAGL